MEACLAEPPLRLAVRLQPLLLSSLELSDTSLKYEPSTEPLHIYVRDLPLSSEEGATLNVLRTFTSEPRPESGLYCLMCAIFARNPASLNPLCVSTSPQGWTESTISDFQFDGKRTDYGKLQSNC